MVFCTYCGQSFSRDEHLQRHILTHSGIKPHRCAECLMSFARRDLLQRHYAVHGRDGDQKELPPSIGMIPKSAGRTPIACESCSKTKTKCSRTYPCTRCVGRNLKCTLRPSRRATKNAQRVGKAPEGDSVPPGVQDGILEAQPNSPPHHPPVLKPASPKTKTGPRPEDKSSPLAVDAPPSFPAEHVASGQSPPGHYSPPVPGYDELPRMTRDNSEAVSTPRFLNEWNDQMQMPIGIGYGMVHQPHMIMNADVVFNPHALPLAPHNDGLISIIPDLGAPPLITPIETPKVERAFSDMELGASAGAFHPHRHASNSSQSMRQDTNGEIPEIIVAQDAWSAFRCTPTIPSVSCPRTARLSLERLEQTLQNHEGWASWAPQFEDPGALGDQLVVMQLHESTREKIMVITQSFLHKALEIHRGGHSHGASGTGQLTPPSSGSNFVLLPPSRVLEYFLQSYSNSFERYFPLTSRGILDANELMHCYNDRASSLLVLLMIAQGAMNIPSIEARMLTGGLTEISRLSLFDLIEKNVIMSGDPIVLHAALIFTVQAAWSGDKTSMDVASGQRGMYFAMLRHSGALENQASAPNPAQHANADRLWGQWIQNETRSRLVYSWAMVDQDMALFYDTAPLFSVTEFGAPMPDADRLWHARNAAEWSSIYEQVHEFSGGYSSIGSGARPLTLRDLFQHFLDDEVISLGIEMTPLQLRLLLPSLQALICQFSQLLSCFSDSLSSRNKNVPRVVSAASTRNRLEEVQSLLQRWYDLAERYLKVNPMCPMMQTNLVVFHLISLNAVTNFPEIERLARREGVDGTYGQLVHRHKRCIADVEEAVYHCGQVFRLVRSMPRSIRPPWWAAAVYRVALILWTDSLVQKETGSPNNGVFPVPGPPFAIDTLSADHPFIIRYLTKREGVPCVTKRDGSQMPIDRGYAVLQHCVEVIDEGASTRFSDGIRNKLDRLARG